MKNVWQVGAVVVVLTVLGTGAVGAQNRAPQGMIAPGQSRQVTLNSGQEHVWTLTIDEDQQVTIDLERVSSSIDPYLELLSMQGGEIETNDDGGRGLNSRISRYLNAGQYMLIAREFGRDDTGQYRLSVSGFVGAPSQGPGGGIPIEVGQTIDAYLTDGQRQTFVLEIATPQQVRIDHMRGDDRNIDPYLILNDQYGNEIESDDDGGDGFNSRITRFLQPGRYLITARDFGSNDSGAFRLSVTGLGGGQVQQGIPIQVGQSVDSFINNGSVQRYILNVSSGQPVRIDVERGADSSIDPYLVLGDRYGNEIETDDDGGSGFNSRINRYLEPGEYTIIARDLGNNSSGSVRVSVTSMQQVMNTGIPITVGQTLDSFITEGQEQAFLLDLSSQTSVVISFDRAEGSGLDPLLELYDTRGNQIARNDDGGSGLNSRISETLQPGQYRIVARDLSNNSSGGFRLSVAPGFIANAIPISVGQSYDGYLNAGQSFVYRLDLTGNRTVTIQFIRTGGSSFDPYVVLSDASGNRIAADDDGGDGLDSRLQQSLGSGTYLIEVRDRSGDRGGSYRVSVQ